jgi:hypothetical protein
LAVELEEQFSVEKKITFKYKCNRKTTCSKIKLGLLNRKHTIVLGLSGKYLYQILHPF